MMFVVLFFFACGGNKPPEPEEAVVLPAQYYYYPRANVYFDSANKEYLFLTADSSAWEKAKQIPAAMQSLLDKSVYIPEPSQPVWKDNDKHKLVYSALLYATPNDTVEKKPVPKVVATRPDTTTPVVDSANEANQKKRSGVRRFLDKLFGGLKKKKDSAQ